MEEKRRRSKRREGKRKRRGMRKEGRSRKDGMRSEGKRKGGNGTDVSTFSLSIFIYNTNTITSWKDSHENIDNRT